MADYFTKFSVVVPLPDAAAQTYALELAAQAESIHLSDEVIPGFPAALQVVAEDWRFDTHPASGTEHALWLDTNTGGIDAACAFIQHLLRKYNPAGRITFEWSFDCSKPRSDAYGGGAAIVTARRIKTMNTSDWLSKHAA
jgi:hypothetical protein